MKRKNPRASATPRRSKGPGYEARRERAIALVQAGATQAEAAKVVGVREATVSAWMQDPAVIERMESVRQDVARVVQETLERRAQELVDSLFDLSADQREKAAGARFNAIKLGLALLGIAATDDDQGGGTRVVVVAPGALDDETRARLKDQARRQKAAGGTE